VADGNRTGYEGAAGEREDIRRLVNAEDGTIDRKIFFR